MIVSFVCHGLPIMVRYERKYSLLLFFNKFVQLALDSKKRIFSWGFGGYGRLGHAEPKDELVPRLLKFFDGPSRGASQLQCGSSFSMAVHEHGERLSSSQMRFLRLWQL